MAVTKVVSKNKKYWRANTMIAGTRHTKDFSGTPEGKAAATKLSDYWAKLQLEAKTKKSRTNVPGRS